MTKRTSWYMLFAGGILIGNLVIGLIDREALGIRLLVKALAAALIAVALLVWWDRRKTAASKEIP